jgi:hypothetical protein
MLLARTMLILAVINKTKTDAIANMKIVILILCTITQHHVTKTTPISHFTYSTAVKSIEANRGQ